MNHQGGTPRLRKLARQIWDWGNPPDDQPKLTFVFLACAVVVGALVLLLMLLATARPSVSSFLESYGPLVVALLVVGWAWVEKHIGLILPIIVIPFVIAVVSRWMDKVGNAITDIAEMKVTMDEMKGQMKELVNGLEEIREHLELGDEEE